MSYPGPDDRLIKRREWESDMHTKARLFAVTDGRQLRVGELLA